MGRPLGYRISEYDYIHVTIWIKKEQWNKIVYLSETSGKTVSNWVVDKTLECTELKEVENEKGPGMIKPLCVPIQKWDIIKQRAEKKGMSISKYVISACLS